MPAGAMQYGVLIYTHDRVDDARINMELVRHHWSRLPALGNAVIVHAFNGRPEWYPEPGPEDALLRCANPGHYRGAADLIDAGAAHFQARFPDVRHVIVLAADTWLLDPDVVLGWLRHMAGSGRVLATCPWGLTAGDWSECFRTGMATDLFIYDQAWARTHRLFPLDYGPFRERHGDLLLYQGLGPVLLEKLAWARFLEAVYREFASDHRIHDQAMDRLLMLAGRMPVHSSPWIRTHHVPGIGLLTHHDAAEKRVLLRASAITAGPCTARFLQDEDLGWFNRPGSRTIRVSSSGIAPGTGHDR